MVLVLSPRFSAPVRERAYIVISQAMGFRPALHRNLLDFGTDAVGSALLALERAFGILLDADEACAARDVAALLDIVEDRERARTCPPCAIHDLASYRRQFGEVLPSREPDLQLDPAVVDAAFPPADDPPQDEVDGRRPLNRVDVLLGVLAGLVIALMVQGWADSRASPPDMDSPGLRAAIDAVR